MGASLAFGPGSFDVVRLSAFRFCLPVVLSIKAAIQELVTSALRVASSRI